jgi:8-oxo-dGTP diphosphatase
MIEPADASLAVDAEGNRLLGFRRCAEDELAELEPGVPLGLALVVAEHAGQVLLVFNSWRLAWELPGGKLDEGESARTAAAREFVEETGLAAPELEFAGVVTFRLKPDDRLEYGAVYRSRLAGPVDVSAFAANEEIDELRWWDLVEELPDSADLDLAIAQLVLA